MRSFESEPTTIGEFFNQKDTVFRVPLYQREYTWSEENVENLLEDLFSGESYFLGTFVLNNEYYVKEKVKDIVDGQQRILTITIFFAVIRDIFLRLKDKQKSGQIQSKYISDKDDDGIEEFKVIASSSAQSFFQKYIQKENTNVEESIPETKEHKKILESYLKIQNKILENLESYSETNSKVERLKDIRELLKSLELIVIEVGNEEDAFTFFETLNSRGTDLTQSDLIKNLIFKNIDKNNSEIEKEWIQIKDNTSSLDGGTEITTFIRHYWLSSNQKITEKNLFREIKKQYKNKSYSELLEILVKESENYRLILSPSSSDWKNEQLDVYKTLKRIQILNIRQSRSLILSILRIIRDDVFFKTHGTKNLIEALKWIEKFTFCFSSVSKKSPPKLENIYSKYAIKINKEYLKPSKHTSSNLNKILLELKTDLVTELPTENEFKDNFIKIEYRKSSKQIALIKYILETINYNGNTEQVFDNVSLEHIIPQTPEADWHLSKEEIEPYVNNIGNIIPVGPEYNFQASNFTLDKKIVFYKNAKILMTTDLVSKLEKNNLEWTESNVRNRNSELANSAWKIWNIK